jgi:hypothetical protein
MIRSIPGESNIEFPEGVSSVDLNRFSYFIGVDFDDNNQFLRIAVDGEREKSSSFLGVRFPTDLLCK